MHRARNSHTQTRRKKERKKNKHKKRRHAFCKRRNV